MTCEDVENALEQSGPEGLTPELHRHVERCAHCQRLVDALEHLEDSLRALPVPPASVRYARDELSSELDDADVVAERRAEAARLDWLEAVRAVESSAGRRRFGPPRIVRRRPLAAQLAFTVLAAAALITIGLIAAVLWNDARAPVNVHEAQLTAGETPGEVKNADRR